MSASVELQVISKILTSNDSSVVETLCGYDDSYYSVFKPHIQYILQHRDKYGDPPDVFTFQAQFPDITLVRVDEPLRYLTSGLTTNKQHILLVETFNKLKDLGSSDVSIAWEYLNRQCERAAALDSTQPLDLIKDAEERSRQVIEYSKQQRIPTGFAEIDKVMYGGLSTVEELLILIARTGNGKSWICSEMMESAQKHGFPVLYYSPEMQASFLGTRFDTWRGHFKNSELHQGNYTAQYLEYIQKIKNDSTSAFVLEDKDAPDDEVNVPLLKKFVKRNGIKLLVIDGLSYMVDARSVKGDKDHTKYKNLCADLFRLSKECGCAAVVVLQANRESRDSKDDKGEVFPNIYNIEGSDHPARIATQVFSMRQIFDKHVLDIRLEKSRTANNQKPVFSYAWDIDTGNVTYLPDGEASMGDDAYDVTPIVNTSGIVPIANPNNDIILDDSDVDVEF